MMRSAAKLAYEEAQAAIDGKPDEVTGPLLEPVLKPLWGAYGSLTRARAERAPLDLDLPERKILLDEQGRVARVTTPERLDAHRLIEEFMIQANVAAAESLRPSARPWSIACTISPRRRSSLRCGVPGNARPQAAEDRAAQARALQPHPRRDTGEPRRGARQRDGAAQPGAGRVQRRELRPLRPEPAPLRAFHLADPPLRRPARAPLADPRAGLGQDGLTDAEMALLEKIAEAIS